VKKLKPAHVRRLPTRTCIACGTGRPKRELIRIVRAPDGTIAADATGRRSGRGAYLCADLACLEKGLAGGQLARALEIAVSSDSRESLRVDLAGLVRQRLAGAQA
jgi:predicted RNA-binding protein YlxR (DUF448 family)